MPSNVCFILGAGFSCAYSRFAPTMENFLKQAKANGAYKPDEDHKILAQVARTYFGSPTELNMEDLATFLLVDLGSDPQKEREQRSSAYSELTEVISQTLGSAHLNSRAQSTRDVYRRFAQLVVEKRFLAVTFNYDLIFDQALCDTNEWSPLDGYGVRIPVGSGADYCLPEAVSEAREGDERYKRTGSRFGQVSKTMLLKPHGSLNWGTRYVPSAAYGDRVEVGFPGALPLIPGQSLSSIGTIWAGQSLGAHGSIPTFWRPFIAPPNTSKLPNGKSGDLLREIWHIARWALKSSDEIYVLGYSLPPSDFEADALFREGLCAPWEGGAEKRVVVVNTDSAVVERFRRRFARPGVVRVEASEHDDVVRHLQALVSNSTGRSPQNLDARPEHQ